MKDPATKDETLDRRNFLRGVSGVALAAATATGISTEARAMDPGKEETRARYRESEHVKAFYRVNRY